MGGTYGGQGANNPKPVYGSVTNPVSLGSGGYDGIGGGAVGLSISNTFILNGEINADGSDRTYGAGSGGSVWIQTDYLSGTGLISAAGGNASTLYTRGGRGWGPLSRFIVIIALFFGGLSTSGGIGAVDGNDGTIIFLSPDSLQAPLLFTPINCPDGGMSGPQDDDIEMAGRTLNPKPPLIWFIPTNNGFMNISFNVYYDTINGTTIQAASSADTTGFTFYDGTNWISYPEEGLVSTDTTIQVCYQPQTDMFAYSPRPTADTNIFWNIEADAGTVVQAISSTNRFIIGGRTWTDATLTGLVTHIRNDHIYELRQEINYARVSRALSSNAWVDTTLTPNQTLIRDDHIMELRTALEELATNLYNKTSATNWTDHPLVPYVTPVRTNHVMELREALEEL